MNRTLLIVLSLIFCSISNARFFSDVETEELLYWDIYRYAREVIADCPKEDCLIIGIGRSPTPLMDYYDYVGIKNTVTLPISSFRQNIHKKSLSLALPTYALDELLESELMEHFENTIGPQVSKGYKKIKIIDFSVSAKSIYAVKNYIDKYLKNKNINSETIATIFHSGDNLNRIRDHASEYKINKKSIRHIVLPESSPLFAAFLNSFFDSYSKYGHFDIEKNISVEKNSSLLREGYLEDLREKIDIIHKEEKLNCHAHLSNLL